LEHMTSGDQWDTSDVTRSVETGQIGMAWERRGVVNGYEASVRGLAFHIAGHELRHLRAIETLYLPLIGERSSR